MKLENEIDVPTPVFPPSVVRIPYRDELIQQFVSMVNEIFLDHPSPLSVTLEYVTFAHSNPAFNPESLFLLADTDAPDRLVGFCRVGFDRGEAETTGWIPLIGVRREWRRHGLGRQMLHWAITYARQQPVTSVCLAVEGENERALHVYEAVGFRPVDEWPRYGRPVTT